MSGIGAGQLDSLTLPIVFRNELHFKIPKDVRRKAYLQAVDIIIESIDFNLYESGKSSPATQFYGYAVFVLQDCLTLEVPIHFPRQRLYFDVQWNAFSQWRTIKELIEFTGNWFDFFFGIIANGSEPPLEKPPISPPDTAFIELPLREVHIKLVHNTQARVEYYQIQPVPFTDNDGNIYSGDSKQNDGDKDQGLPPDGIQPKRNDPTSPYGGNNPLVPPPSEWSLPYGNLDSVDPNNGTNSSTPPEDYGYFLKVTARSKLENACSDLTCDYFYLISENDTSFTLSDWQSDQLFCGQVHKAKYLNGNYSGRIDSFYYIGDLTWEVIRSPDKPPNVCRPN